MPELLYLTQPTEELERQAQEKLLRFNPAGLAEATWAVVDSFLANDG
ncbi:hypothetical protein [uncultured Microbacterium sp.]